MYFGLIIVRAIVFLSKYLSVQMSSGQMSFWGTIIWANVFLGKCLSGQLSFWANVFLGKCLSGQLSFWANVFLGKRPCGQTSSGQMSFWTNVFLANVLLGNFFLGKCLSEQMSFWANVVWANVMEPLHIIAKLKN
jgi:hypothetical protein